MNGFTSLIGTILIITVVVFKYIASDNLTYVTSDIDNARYLVRDTKDKQSAANMLARIKQNMDMLVNNLNMYKNTAYIEYKPYIEQLNDRIKDVVIHETPENSNYTSYSVNKGEKLVFCIRSKKVANKIHQQNLLMYVTLHEMAHIACPEFGHTALFKKIFAFFTETAINLGIYTKIQFEETPTEYCGLIITNSIV
jgi:hypothetical protein